MAKWAICSKIVDFPQNRRFSAVAWTGYKRGEACLAPVLNGLNSAP